MIGLEVESKELDEVMAEVEIIKNKFDSIGLKFEDVAKTLEKFRNTICDLGFPSIIIDGEEVMLYENI